MHHDERQSFISAMGTREKLRQLREKATTSVFFYCHRCVTFFSLGRTTCGGGRRRRQHGDASRSQPLSFLLLRCSQIDTSIVCFCYYHGCTVNGFFLRLTAAKRRGRDSTASVGGQCGDRRRRASARGWCFEVGRALVHEECEEEEQAGGERRSCGYEAFLSCGPGVTGPKLGRRAGAYQPPKTIDTDKVCNRSAGFIGEA